MKKKLTVIIPFVNEGEEVERTIESALNHSNNDIEIIAINDASDDCYDYEKALQKYPVKYVLNEKRLGVAASRDKGVRLCNTDYFLLLDAHMRFYDSAWVKALVSKLNAHPKTVLCTQTKPLHKVEGKIVNGETKTFWGAYVNFYAVVEYMESLWTYVDWLHHIPKNEANEIPCVLGAGYATSKTYWEYINGLQGLLSYGSDEVLLSMKVWLSGGKCKLLPQVTIGHIYRQCAPYEHYREKRIYNKLYIGYMLCPSVYRKKLYAVERTKFPFDCLKAWKLFYQNLDVIEKAKTSFEQIRTQTFQDFERFNRSRKFREKDSPEIKEKILEKSLLFIISQVNTCENIGLVNGKLGVIILLYHYARYKKNPYITSLASTFLNEVIKQIDMDCPLNMSNGLLGIGWGIGYLFQQRFLRGDVNEILADIDRKVMEFSPSRIHDLNIEYGLGGILRYVLCRLYDTNGSFEYIFPQVYLQELYHRSKEVMNKELINNCPETYIEYILYYEKKKEIEAASIYDILILPGWNKFSKACKDISMRGLSGMCLEYLLTLDLMK